MLTDQWRCTLIISGHQKMASLPFPREECMRKERKCMRAGTLAAGTVLAMTGMFTGVSEAAPRPSASTFSNGFEGNPWNSWQGLAEGDGWAGADVGKGLAHTGANNGWLNAGRGWAAERIPISIGSWGDRGNCSATIFAQPVDDPDGDGGAQVGLAIWNPNGWRELTSTISWLPGTGWQPITTPPVNLSDVDTVYVQAIYGQNSGIRQFIRLDDLTLTCS